MSVATARGENDAGSVAVTLAAAVTMLLIVVGLVTQVLFQLAQHTVLVHETAGLLRQATQADEPCAWFGAALDQRFAAVTADCVAHADRLVARSVDTNGTRFAPEHAVQVVVHVDR